MPLIIKFNLNLLNIMIAVVRSSGLGLRGRNDSTAPPFVFVAT